MSGQSLTALVNATLPADRKAIDAYYRAKLPEAKDNEIAAVLEAYKNASPVERDQAASALTGEQISWLDTYSYRMSMLSVRQNSPALLQNGIVALLMLAKKNDPRETVMGIPVLHRSAELLGQPDAAFQAAAQFGPDEATKKLLLGFLNRAAEDKRIEAMGYRELNGAHGIIFVYGNQPVPDGLL